MGGTRKEVTESGIFTDLPPLTSAVFSVQKEDQFGSNKSFFHVHGTEEGSYQQKGRETLPA